MINDSIWKNYNDIGCTAYANGKFELAQRMFEAAVDESKKLGQKDPRLGTSLSNLALACQQKGDIKRAIPTYKRAIEALELARTENITPMVTAVDSLAELYLSLGDYVKARPLFKRVIALYEKQFGPDCHQLASRYTRLAWIYCQDGKFERAMQYRRRAQEIKDKAAKPWAS